MNFDDILIGLLYGQMAVGILLVLALLCHLMLTWFVKLQTYWLRVRFGNVVYREILRFMNSEEGQALRDKMAKTKEWKAVEKQEGF